MKKLSLLSGGEKSLVALAFMFAVFLARPCPFYILDEVEAALDDLNIDRFLQLVHRYSDRAQFIIVTHQKRTMDAADVLYGVSMGGDGISKVVSRKLPTREQRSRRSLTRTKPPLSAARPLRFAARHGPADRLSACRRHPHRPDRRGGGSLMTPLLLIAGGYSPVVTIGTDLAYGAITKTVGGWRHLRAGHVDLALVVVLAAGSTPGSARRDRRRTGSTRSTARPSSRTSSAAVAVALMFASSATLYRALFRPGLIAKERDAGALQRRASKVTRSPSASCWASSSA